MPALALVILVAAAGGGSSGYGGGGGGGFSGGGGAGGGSGGGRPLVFLVVVVAFLLLVLYAGLQTRKARKRREARRRAVELASAVAADDDPRLAADQVVQDAERIYRSAQAAWDARDDARLRELLSPDLLVEWRRRLADFADRGWHNRVEVLGVESVEFLGLVNRDGEHEDRVTCRITARLHDWVEITTSHPPTRINRAGASSPLVTLTEYWTLARRDGEWIVASIESDAEGAHVIEQEIVATPWQDEQRMRDASLVEVAVADKLPAGVATAEVADLDYAGDARAAALDLSLADGRWAPDVLEAAARRAVAAWAEAVDGADRDLLDVATPQAADALLHPGDASRKTRLVIRGPRVRRLQIAALDPAATPPTMTVEVEVRGRRYVEDRDDASVRSGSKERETTVRERWTLALCGPDERPWQVVSVG
ncbi:MAG TPA: TIM44-like domain-containing protein [Conexibacter sp.]|nr:TIM44-like domain-containing protein [Conexibacter sp.]